MTDGPTLSLRLNLGDGVRFGPGKADLLEGIAATKSIAAAARGMRMSYRRAWLLVAELNRSFDAPLVARSRGGTAGGGASLTALGEHVLAEYRRIEAEAQRAARTSLVALAKRRGAARRAAGRRRD